MSPIKTAEQELPKAKIMPSTLKEPIQVTHKSKNGYGLDVSYFLDKLSLIIRDIGSYKPDEMYRELSKLASVVAPEQVPEDWMPIETAPKRKKIIVKYKSAYYGKYVTVFAEYIERFTEESTCAHDGHEYDEKTDTYYLKEGWYELIDNWDEFTSVYFDSRNLPTHWMHAPATQGE